MIVTVASGKGGTGKTLVATGLAAVVAESCAVVCLLDCDVEAPNAHLFLKPALTGCEEVSLPVPQVDLARCTFCGRCAEVCAFHALAVVGRQVLTFAELCHGCGSCARQCPEGAISEVPRRLGVVEWGWAGRVRLARGVLDVGQAMATPVIRRLKQRALEGVGGPALVLLDAPPGNACAVVETLRGSDFALLVTEPTPFGLHDLEIAVQVAREELGLPVGVVINRDGIGDGGVEGYCAHAGLPILLRIPFDRRIAAACAAGGLWVDAVPEYREGMRGLYRTLQETGGAAP
ncbi:MAG TPA: ATP-binding protein [Anaerolineae bacterium]|nr:ATP-binding protein [Anaerolineae bacterium]HPL28260.1 ATP-binding protein [Anaerolineae bacterium]